MDRDEDSGVLPNTTKKELIRKYIGEGLTYRQIAKEMGFKSVSTVSFYAKEVHQHRLRWNGEHEAYECQVCKKKFVESTQEGDE